MVFENDMELVWPLNVKERAKRKAEIEAWAKSHGLVVMVHDPGMRATFRKAQQPSA
jgi:hypothetical protein